MKKRYTLAMLALCFLFLLPHAATAESKKTSFRITVLKSTGEPQPGMLLKINGQSTRYTGDSLGVISFDFALDNSYTRTANLYFPSDDQTPATSFMLKSAENTRTFYLDSPADIIGFKQQNHTFSIEGLLENTKGEPVEGAVVSIQGTGRKVMSDEIGLFRIEADYNHPVYIRATGMENLLLEITPFLRTPDEPYRITMRPKGSDRIYTVVEEMPEYPGGMKAFVNYLKRNLKYPEKAKRDSIEGVVVVRFVVEKNGIITSPTVVRGLEPSMDAAALEAIRQMPRWIPGREQDMRVRCRYSLPVRFKIARPKPAPKVPAVKADSVLFVQKDSLQTDSLRTDSLRTLIPANDSLRAGLLTTASDSLLAKADTLLTATDSLQQDSTAKALAQPDATAVKPKKRNIFVRFFRWLFGIKDKPVQAVPTEKEEGEAEENGGASPALPAATEPKDSLKVEPK